MIGVAHACQPPCAAILKRVEVGFAGKRHQGVINESPVAAIVVVAVDAPVCSGFIGLADLEAGLSSEDLHPGTSVAPARDKGVCRAFPGQFRSVPSARHELPEAIALAGWGIFGQAGLEADTVGPAPCSSHRRKCSKSCHEVRISKLLRFGISCCFRTWVPQLIR